MLVVDRATGAMYKLPPSVEVVLDADTSGAAALDLKITSIEMISQEQRRQLQPLAI